MQRTATAALAALVVIGTLAAVPVAMAQGTDQTNRTAGNSSVAPGEQLSAVVGVGEAELSGDVESRAYSIRVDRANSSDAKAAVVADQLNATTERLAELEAEKAALETARENGSISEGQYRARVATLHAESRNMARLANQTNETAAGLPAATLEANGVNVTAIRTLQDRAGNLTGPETAAIARGIAGENAGQTARPGEAADRSGNGSDRAGAAGGSGDEMRGGSTDGATSTNETRDGSAQTDGGDSGPPAGSGTRSPTAPDGPN